MEIRQMRLEQDVAFHDAYGAIDGMVNQMERYLKLYEGSENVRETERAGKPKPMGGRNVRCRVSSRSKGHPSPLSRSASLRQQRIP